MRREATSSGFAPCANLAVALSPIPAPRRSRKTAPASLDTSSAVIVPANRQRACAVRLVSLTLGRCGEQAARVPVEVIEEIRSRMNGHNVVWVSEVPSLDPPFAKAQRERVRALERLVAAGFRVEVA